MELSLICWIKKICGIWTRKIKINKKIGVLVILLGILVLFFYKNAGFYGFGGYVDKSWENIIISLILIVIGIIILNRKKES